MPSQDEIASDLRRAVDLKSLLDQARVLGIDHVLDHPLEALYELPELGSAGADLLDDLSDDLGDLPTLGELVTDPDLAETVRREATAKQRRQLQAALAAHFAREAVGAERKGQAPARAALEAWAAEHQVSDLLLAPLRMLEKDCDAHLRHWPFRRPTVAIRFLFEPGSPAMRGVPDKVVDGLKRAARRFLERGAAERRAGLAEEEARLATPPVANPAARALRERLLAARAAVRAFALPRPRSAWPRMAVGFEPDPPTWVVAEEEWPHRTRVELALQGADPLVLACTCSRGAPAQCAHALTAIDAFLDHLADPGKERDTAEILAELARPAWARTLADLDARLAPPAEPEPFRLRWRIQQRGKLLNVVPALQRPTKAGVRSRGSRTRASVVVRALPADALPADREAATLLALAERVGISSSRDLVVRAVRALVGHDGVTLATPPHQPLTVRRGTIGFEAIDQPAGGIVLRPTVAGDPIDAGLLADALDPEDELAVVVDEERRMCNLVEEIRPEARAVVALLARRGGAFPADALAALTERLPALAARVPLRLPPSLRGAEVAADERILLRLDLLDEAGMRVRAMVRPLAEGPAYAPGQGPPEIVGWRDAGRVHVRRDLHGEGARVRAAVSTLSLATEAEQEPFVWMLGSGEQALDLLSALRDAEGRYVVEWAGEPRRVTRAATTADLRLRIEDKRDWFGLSGGLDVDGVTVPLAQILEAMRGGRRYLEVKGGLWVRLGDELRARLEPAGDLVGGRGGLEVSPLAAPAVADLVGYDAVMTRRFQKLLLRIREARESIPEPPAELAGILRDYQVTGFRWLARLAAWGAGACLADDMGLGKTVQALALLSARASLGPALVVAPTSVGWNWLREARRFTPSLRPIHYREVDRKRTLSELGAGDVLVISYGLLARDAEELAGLTFSTLVLDEAQAIKNPATQRARAAAALSADFRLALTGTPLENRLGELWSLFRAVTPGLLGSWERFRERFAAPIERDDDEGRRGALARLVRPFILRRMKADVAPELPARTEVREDIVLSPPERALYDELRRAALTALAAPTGAQPQQRRFQILAALTRLRQLACHPRLVDERSPIASSKLERCLELIEELRAGNHRALVFSQFTGHLALLREALDASAVPYLYLDGQTSAGQRQQRVDAFQRGEGDLFLISLKAGGTGLNLTGADYVIHLDPWWNPAVEDQATDRAHRIGQERPVTVYRLVARGTIEEGILDLHADKRRLVAGILEGTGTATSVSTEELLQLLREGGIEG